LNASSIETFSRVGFKPLVKTAMQAQYSMDGNLGVPNLVAFLRRQNAAREGVYLGGDYE
jgi:hypothetical protein